MLLANNAFENSQGFSQKHESKHMITQHSRASVAATMRSPDTRHVTPNHRSRPKPSAMPKQTGTHAHMSKLTPKSETKTTARQREQKTHEPEIVER